MGGRILEYEAKAILEQGKLQTYMELIKDGIMTLKEAADRLNMKEEELEEKMGIYIV